MARNSPWTALTAQTADRRRLLLLACGFAAAAALRLALLARLRSNYDLESFEIVARIVRAGGNVYAETTRYNYSPLWAGMLGVLSRVADALGVPLARAVTTLLLLCDAGAAVLVARILRARGLDPVRAAARGLLFFANPVSVLASSVRGMFDGAAILFLLLSILAMTSRPARRGFASVAMSVSLLVKHVAWFHPILLARKGGGSRPRGVAAALLPYALFFASFAPFWRSWPRLRSQVFGYSGMDEPYGLEPLRIHGFLPAWGPSAVCAIAGVAAAAWLAARGVETVRASRVLFLVVLLVLPGVTPYYFVWPIALGAIEPGAGYAVYTSVVTLFFIHSPDGLGVEWAHLPGWWGVWWAVALWLLLEIREIRKARSLSAL